MNSMPQLPPISRDANKYTRGSLLVLAGSRRYFGAGVLATLAAEKTGAGYVSLATPASAALAAKHQVLCSPVIEAPEGETGCFASNALSVVLSEIHRFDAFCCGPGMTVHEHTGAFLGEVLRYTSLEGIPLLLDADALNILASKPTLLGQRRLNAREYPDQLNPLILTPHQGELTRLYQAFICETVEELARQLGVIVVSKGPTTWIAGSGELFECSKATPALSKAGTGDVLAGIISSLLAQGKKALEAALLGVQIHSLAGVLAEQKLGRRSVTALDVIYALPDAVTQFETEQTRGE